MILSFGQTVRAKSACFISNTTTGSLWIPFLREMIQAGQTRQMPFANVDHVMRNGNEREGTVYTINGSGTPYLDDVDQFCKLVTTGDVIVSVATGAEGSLTKGASAVFTTFGDGSVSFS